MNGPPQGGAVNVPDDVLARQALTMAEEAAGRAIADAERQADSIRADGEAAARAIEAEAEQLIDVVIHRVQTAIDDVRSAEYHQIVTAVRRCQARLASLAADALGPAAGVPFACLPARTAAASRSDSRTARTSRARSNLGNQQSATQPQPPPDPQPGGPSATDEPYVAQLRQAWEKR